MCPVAFVRLRERCTAFPQAHVQTTAKQGEIESTYRKRVLAIFLLIGLSACTLLPPIALGQDAPSPSSGKQHRARLGIFRKVEHPIADRYIVVLQEESSKSDDSSDESSANAQERIAQIHRAIRSFCSVL
jgi:hypothetical protein